MAGATLRHKMRLKTGMAAGVVHAPPGYIEKLAAPKGTSVKTDLKAGPFDWLQIFVRSQPELDALAGRLMSALKPQGLLWLSFPKGTSKIQTDLTRDRGWDALKGLPLKWINLISVDDTWSAFALRPYKPGEQQQSFR